MSKRSTAFALFSTTVLGTATLSLLADSASLAADKRSGQKTSVHGSLQISTKGKMRKVLKGLLIKHYAWLFGDADIAVSREGISISSPNRSAVTVSKAPFKSIVCYDKLRKTFYETRPDAGGSFLIQRYMKMLGSDPHPPKWKKVEEGTIAGMKAGKYVADQPVSQTREDRFDKSQNTLIDMRVSGFWVAEDPEIPAGAADVVLKMEGFPMIHKMPLRFTMSGNKSADKRARVETYSISKVTFPADKFEVPGGFRKINAEYSLQGEEMELFEGGDRAGLSRKR